MPQGQEASQNNAPSYFPLSLKTWGALCIRIFQAGDRRLNGRGDTHVCVIWLQGTGREHGCPKTGTAGNSCSPQEAEAGGPCEPKSKANLGHLAGPISKTNKMKRNQTCSMCWPPSLCPSPPPQRASSTSQVTQEVGSLWGLSRQSPAPCGTPRSEEGRTAGPKVCLRPREAREARDSSEEDRDIGWQCPPHCTTAGPSVLLFPGHQAASSARKPR